MFKYLSLWGLIALFAVGTAVGCNTIEGAAEDTEEGAEAVGDAAD